MGVREKDETIILRVPSWMKNELKKLAGDQSISEKVREILKNYLIKKGT